MEALRGVNAPGRMTAGAWLKPRAVTLAVAMALGLSGCGGGGGGNTRPTTPPAPPPSSTGFSGGQINVDANSTLVLPDNYSGSINLIKGGAGTLTLTGTNNYSGGTTIDSGILQLGNGATTGSISGNVVDNALLVFNRSDDVTFGGAISGTGALEQAGSGTLILTGANIYGGVTRIDSGSLQLGNGGTTGSIMGNVVDNALLVFNRSDDVTFGGAISGTGALEQAGSGTLILTGANTYTGGTTISHGTLQLGDGGTSGWIVGDVINHGTLAFDRSDDISFANVIAGTGGLVKLGDNALTLTGTNSYGGSTQVRAGTLYVDGDQLAATGETIVSNGATLGGTGVLGGDVTLNDGATLSPGDKEAVGTFTIGGNLLLSSGTKLEFGFGQAAGGAVSGDLVNVHGNLTLDGMLNIDGVTSGDLGPGVVRRLFNYDGTLLDNGLDLGGASSGFGVQTGVANQVNLINTQGMQLSFWDGDAGPKGNGVIDGGSGTWQGGALSNDNWTGANGAVNTPFIDGSFAIFQGTPGTVTVDASQGDINVAGLQFASNGFVIQGDPIHLVGSAANPSQSIIRVGEGDAGDAYDTATINSVLVGASALVKTDAGTLVLGGNNTYTGGTVIRGGTLQIGSGGTSGSITGDVTNDASLVFNRSGSATYGGVISGSGSLTQAGSGTLILTGENTYTGGTMVSSGTLQIGDGGTTGSVLGNITNNSTLAFNRGDSFVFSGNIGGSGDVVKSGAYTLTLTGDNTYTGTTTISNGDLQVGNGGATPMLPGNVFINGYNSSLIINRSGDFAYGGTVSGSGNVVKLGAGTMSITGTQTFSGQFQVLEGTLALGSGASMNETVVVGGAGQNASLQVDAGATAYKGVNLGDQGSLSNRGTIMADGSVVQAFAQAAITNYQGGLIEGVITQMGLDVAGIGLGANSVLTNYGTISGYTALSSSGVVNNIGGTISGRYSKGITGNAVLINNTDGGTISAGPNQYNIPIAQAVSSYASNVEVNNLRGSTIVGQSRGVELTDGGTVTNDGGSRISANVGVFIANVGTTPAVVNNLGGSTITGANTGVTLMDGGRIVNDATSTITATKPASGDCSAGAACAIYVPVFQNNGNYGANGSLDLTNAGTIAGNVQMDPNVINNVTLMAGGHIQGALKIGANVQSTLTLGGDAGTTQFYSSAVSGGTTFGGVLAKNGGGTWIIDTSDLQGAVSTSVNGGILGAMQALSGNVTVNAPGKVDRVPGVAGNLVNAGVVAVHGGDSNVGGDYTQSSTGTLAISLGSKLAVTGAATLNGGTLEITGADQGYVSSTHTPVLTASGGLTGTFAQLVKGAGVVFTATTINYDGNSAWLDTTGLNVTTAAAGNGVTYTPVSFGSAQRVQAAFTQLDNKIATNSLSTVPAGFVSAAGQFQQAPTLQAAQTSLDSLSGQLHAASAAMTFEAIDASSRALADHFDDLLGNNGRVGMWTQSLSVGGDMSRSGYDGVGFQLNGWLVGNDRKIGSSGVAGYAFGQSQGLQRLDLGYDQNRSRSTEGMLYAGWLSGNWYAQGRVGLGHFQQDVSRQLLLGTSAQGVATTYSGAYSVAYGETGLHLGLAGTRITPFASVEYAGIRRDGFAEEGAGGFGLRAQAQFQDRWQAGFGLRALHHWDLDGGRAIDFQASARFRRTFASQGDIFDASFVGLQQWQPLVGIGLSKYSGALNVGLDAKLSARASMMFGYDYEKGQRDQAQMVSARMVMAF